MWTLDGAVKWALRFLRREEVTLGLNFIFGDDGAWRLVCFRGGGEWEFHFSFATYELCPFENGGSNFEA